MPSCALSKRPSLGIILVALLVALVPAIGPSQLNSPTSLLLAEANAETLRENSVLIDEVMARISEHAEPGRRSIRVTGRVDTIWLDGEVSSGDDKEKIGDLARNAPNVAHVFNNLHVVAPANQDVETANSLPNQGLYGADTSENSEKPPVKDELALAVSESLRTNLISNKRPNADQNLISVSSHQGTIKLTGTVLSEAESERATSLARAVPGVSEVINQLRPVPPLSDENIAQRLQGAFTENGITVPATINYSVEKGVVTFSGTAVEHKDVDRLLSVALMVEGVKDLKSTVKCKDCSVLERSKDPA